MAGFTPIEDYGLIGDSRSAALVSRSGSVDWLCFPTFDSESIFCALLDPAAGGFFQIVPAEDFKSNQTYLPDTNVLVTEFQSRSGKIRILDALSAASEKRKSQDFWPNHELLRVVDGVEGEVPVRMRFLARQGYGKAPVTRERLENWGLRFVVGHHVYFLQSDLGFEKAWLQNTDYGDEVVLEFVIRAGERVSFSLSYDDIGPAVMPAMGKAALDRLETMIDYWRSWIDRCKYRGPYADHVIRSALTLKLMQFAPSGAFIAAPTTSLPESPRAGRNWDYRFCWLRDAAFTIRALTALGYFDEARAHMSWLLHSTRLTQPRLQVVYSVYGQARLQEKPLHWLRGYEDSRPVRVGNAASEQLQIDIYGEVIDSFQHMLPHFGSVDRDTRELLLGMAETVADNWDKPDSGIWEFRGPRRHYTHSKLMSWLAMKRMDAIAKKLKWKTRRDYGKAAVAISDAIESQGYSVTQQAYMQSFGGSELDASLLLMPLVHYDASPGRVEKTIRAIQRSLAKNGLVYRYRPQSDGMEGHEGAFGICSFWMAQALCHVGEHGEAKTWMDAILGRANPLGLWPEEIDPVTGRFLGNYPQAFTHIGLINAALQIQSASEMAA